MLAFGSDWDVAPMKPLPGIYAAVTRRPLMEAARTDGCPNRKLPLPSRFAPTRWEAPMLLSRKTRKGSLKAGKLADFVVLSEDIFHIDPPKIRDARVDVTVMGGKVVYERK